ncbi:MAG: ATP-binding protein, partial [Desulfomonilaceae bacterium]
LYGKYVSMIRRYIVPRMLEALKDTPVVFLRGPRQTGKTTIVQHIAQDYYPVEYVTMDNVAALAAARSDPRGFIAGLAKPVVIDEVQRGGDLLLLAIKEDVDRDRTPGRYILTGSANILTLPRASDALAGRMQVFTLWPLSLSELTEGEPHVIELLFGAGFLASPLTTYSEIDVFARITAGGFPEAIKRESGPRRRAWFDSYLTTMVERDIRDLARVQDLVAAPRLLALLAARTGTLHNQSEVSRASGIPNTTLSRYMALLETTFLIKTLPAWTPNLGKRIVKSPKLFMTDTGLACHLVGIGEDRLRDRGEIVGRLFENFVVMELYKHASWSRDLVRLFHFRAHPGTEVDVIIEDGSGNVIGVEVKFSRSPSAKDFSGLKALASALGDRFVRGILMYPGAEWIPFGRNLYAAPVAVLGASGSREVV